MKLASVIVFTKDMDKMRAFYRDQLGLAILEDSEGWTKFDAGGCSVALHAIPPSTPPTSK